MSKREEFLRAMGISANDMMNPDESTTSTPTKAKATNGGGSSRMGSSLLIHRNVDGRCDPATSAGGASASKASKSAGTPTGMDSMKSVPSRAEPKPSGFTPQPPQRKPMDLNLSATGSQEVPAAEFRSAQPASQSRSSASAQDLMKEVEQLKQEGNEAFQRQEFRKAIRCYSKAIEGDPSNAALYSNRSAAYLAGGPQTGMDTRSLALRDAVKAAELNPTWPKAFCRQAEALIELERYAEAKSAYERAAELDPTSDVFRLRARECAEKVGPQRAHSTLNPDLRAREDAREEASRISARELQAKYLNEEGGDILRGNEFKEAELERLRQRRSSDSFSGSSSGTATTSGRFGGAGSSGYISAARNVPREYSSDAAKAYQQALLEEYRKRKAQGKAT